MIPPLGILFDMDLGNILELLVRCTVCMVVGAPLGSLLSSSVIMEPVTMMETKLEN